jgi:flagellar secretion chaperone FliS
VVNILTELSNTLDFENGGEMAVQLDSVYWYMIKELIRSNTQDDPEPLNVAERILADLRDGWIGAMRKTRTGTENLKSDMGRCWRSPRTEVPV